MNTQRSISLRIEGMHCGNCVAKVARALTTVAGVDVERLEIGGATVRVQNAESDIAAILDAVNDAGYPAVLADP
jgi:copper chaperone CopZ